MEPERENFGEAVQRLGFDISWDYCVSFPGGRKITVDLVVWSRESKESGFKGMLIDEDSEKLTVNDELIVSFGFGFSCFEAKSSDYRDDESTKEVLRDWGMY